MLALDTVQKKQNLGIPPLRVPLVMYFSGRIMRHNPQNPRWFNRDRRSGSWFGFALYPSVLERYEK